MKKLTTSLSVLAWVLVTVLHVSGPAASAQAPAASGQYRVGLIDMAYVFKNYKKFEALREDLKAEIQKSDDQAKAMATRIQQVQERMKAYNEASPEFAQTEKELAKLASEFEAFRKVAQRDFLRKEADIYKTVYLEVSQAVKLYAEYKNYSMIVRFSRDDVEDAGNPKAVLQSMNRQVVYFKDEHDITEPVLQYLNKQYGNVAGSPAPRN